MQPWRAILLLAAITDATPQQQRQHQPLQKVLLVLTVARRDRFYLTRRYERFFGTAAETMGGLETLDLARGRFHFVTLDQAGTMLQGFVAPTLPYTCGQGLGSQDLTATRSFLSGAGIMPVYEDDDFCCVGPDDALGAYLLFHDKGIDAPWVSLAERQ